MATNQVRITPEILYSISKMGSMEKISELEKLTNNVLAPYDVSKDYYRRLRNIVFKCFKTNRLDKLLEEVERIRFKDEVQRSAFLTLANVIIYLFSNTSFRSSSKVLCKKALCEGYIISSPTHLSLEVGNEKWILWFYFCQTELPQDRIQYQLQLMRHLSEVQGIPTIVDVQRERIFQAEEKSIFSFVVKQDIEFINSFLISKSKAA